MTRIETVALLAVATAVFLLLLYLGGQGLDRVGRRGIDFLTTTLPVLRRFLGWRGPS
jgi:hypothetical protein